MDTYLGETAQTWLELKKRAEKLDVLDLVREIGMLRGKVSFYESRLDDMDRFKLSDVKREEV